MKKTNERERLSVKPKGDKETQTLEQKRKQEVDKTQNTKGARESAQTFTKDSTSN